MTDQPNTPDQSTMDAAAKPKSKRGGKRTQSHRIRREARQARISELYLKSTPVNEIATILDVSRVTIWHDMKAIRAEWKASRLRDFDDMVEQELQKIDRIEREAWDAWERSKADAQSVTTEMAKEGRKIVGAKKEKRTSAGQVGDPRFLDAVNKAIESRRKLLGLDAPTRTDTTLSGSLTIGGPTLTPEQMRAEIIERLRGGLGKLPAALPTATLAASNGNGHPHDHAHDRDDLDDLDDDSPSHNSNGHSNGHPPQSLN